MAVLTPGLVFLSHRLLSLVCLSVLVASVRLALNAYLGLSIPAWAYVVLTALCTPLALIMRIILDEMHHRRRASVLGARMVPRVIGRSFGNVDLLKTVFKETQDGYPADLRFAWASVYGNTYNLRVFWDNLFMTDEPDTIKLILASDFANYEKGNKLRNSLHSVLGTGVFNSDGNMWKFHRSMTRPFFSRDRISDFENFAHHADNVIYQMKTRFKEGYAVDFQDAISRFTLDSASEFLLGQDVQSLSTGFSYPHCAQDYKDSQDPYLYLSPAEAFSCAFKEAQEALAQRVRGGPIWPIWEIFKDNTARPMKVVDAYLLPIVNKAIEKQRDRARGCADDDKIGEEETLLDHLVTLTTDKTVLRDEILNILVASRDTTASTLTFVIYFLATNPTVLARLREEVLTKVGPSARPTYADIKDMKYLRAVVNETLRLFPPVPFNVRGTVRETMWPSTNPTEKPFYIPAKSSCLYSVFAMHRRTDLWGSDALEFDPDRFLDERVQYFTANPFIFLPFNAGPRICLGQQFAYNEMSFMIIRLLQNFSSISLDPSAQPPETLPPVSWARQWGRKGIEQFRPKSHLTMYSYGGLWVTMKQVEAM
ncbi:cytochrome P450 [Athelia psychrophila]|uniref:Cytochrome P450 n=1 Tax=Athelia psychrophila TaxID=1759441 RepID=A0A166J667_9AGAM|nr:cytochrome P450 [Fibularhizoctonia sp. CBS 109695]